MRKLRRRSLGATRIIFTSGTSSTARTSENNWLIWPKEQNSKNPLAQIIPSRSGDPCSKGFPTTLRNFNAITITSRYLTRDLTIFNDPEIRGSTKNTFSIYCSFSFNNHHNFPTNFVAIFHEKIRENYFHGVQLDLFAEKLQATGRDSSILNFTLSETASRPFHRSRRHRPLLHSRIVRDRKHVVDRFSQKIIDFSSSSPSSVLSSWINFTHSHSRGSNTNFVRCT